PGRRIPTASARSPNSDRSTRSSGAEARARHPPLRRSLIIHHIATRPLKTPGRQGRQSATTMPPKDEKDIGLRRGTCWKRPHLAFLLWLLENRPSRVLGFFRPLWRAGLLCE